MGRAPYNTLVIPYKKEIDTVKYCILLRKDMNAWQFVAGGGEDDETPMQAAIRETVEESGIPSENKFTQLVSTDFVPVYYFSKEAQENWGSDVFVIPNYSFAVEVNDYNITLSSEHIDYKWLNYDEVVILLKFDGNKTALWELKCRIEKESL